MPLDRGLANKHQPAREIILTTGCTPISFEPVPSDKYTSAKSLAPVELDIFVMALNALKKVMYLPYFHLEKLYYSRLIF